MPSIVDVYVIVFVLLSTAFHEMAHAFTAYWLGDPTPGRHGRLTLNPIPHLKPISTAIVIPVLMYLSYGALMILAFTPIDPTKFRKPLRDRALVAIAGPITNVLLAALAIGILWIPGFVNPFNYNPGGVTVSESISYRALKESAFWNLILAVFNMLPIPPLDGYWIARAFLPLRIRFETDKFASSPLSPLIVLIVGSWLVGHFIYPISKLVYKLVPL